MSASKKAIHFIPPNKIVIDEVRLKKLYQQGYGCRYLSQVFQVHHAVIKRRVKALGINRTSKQTCSSPLFKQRMSAVRLKTLLNNPHEMKRVQILMGRKDVIEARLKGMSRTPTSIERLIYDELEERDIPFEKQVVINSKFKVDVYLSQQKTVIECDGDYWHTLPKVVARDKAKNAYLTKCGYKVFHFWEHEIRKDAKKCVDNVISNL
jgi:very-short-patch-repair endonuclease